MPEVVEFGSRRYELLGPDDLSERESLTVGEAIERAIKLRGGLVVSNGGLRTFSGSRFTPIVVFSLIAGSVRERREEDGLRGLVRTLVPKSVFNERDGETQTRLAPSATYTDMPFGKAHRIVCYYRPEEGGE